MASATLEFEEELEGRLVFRVEADPFDAPPFAGPPGRGWDAFVVQRASDATYEWETGADRERSRARRLVQRGLVDSEVLAAFRTSDYLSQVDEFVTEQVKDDEDLSFADSLSRYRYVIEGIADGSWNPAEADAPWSYYMLEGDAHLGDAAEALPLPPGAEIDERDDGGMGCGYTARFLVLPPAMTLADFAAWLASWAREAEQPGSVP